MIFYRNKFLEKITTNIEDTKCNGFEELSKKGWEMINITQHSFYMLDEAEPSGYYEWTMGGASDRFRQGVSNGMCFLSETNAKKAVKYLRRLSNKDLEEVENETAQ